MAKKTNTELVRVNINLPMNIVNRVKEYADGLGINATSAYIVLLNQALEQKDALNQLPAMFSLLSEVQKLNEIADNSLLNQNK